MRVHSLTLFAFFALPGACDVIPGPSSWPTTLQPSCFGHEPKARVVTVGILGLPLGSPETKCHLDVAPVEKLKVY